VGWRFGSRLVAKGLPFSTCLANQGWKVANIPLHPDMSAPKELFETDQKKVFGLIIGV
jgi:regulator of PEP synthase PpsR (kinase-PPPase family)